MAALDRLGLTGQTLVIWTSDNGAVQRNPPQGSGAPYKGAAYNTSEAAMRMPCVMKWPAHVPAGRVSDEIISTMDLLPSFARLAGAGLPERAIDGRDVRPMLLGEPNARSPWDEQGFMYYQLEQLQAVRCGPWKLYLPLAAKFQAINRRTAPAALALYNVRDDVSETREVSAQQPAVVQRLTALADAARQELGDMANIGSGQRPAGHVAQPRALTK